MRPEPTSNPMSSPEADAAVSKAQELQDGFFSAPNLFRLRPEECPAELAATMEGLQPFLRRYARGQTGLPLLLPVRLPDDPFTVWYACADNEQQLLALAAELKAFIGPTYAWFRLPEDGKFVADVHAQPLLKRGGLRHFVMWTQDSKQDARLLQKWRMYCDLMERRPRFAARIAKSFDALRADFDRALLVRDEGAAHLALASMRDWFGISAENRLFLEIRLFAGLEQWERISGHPLLTTLAKLNLPQETYGDILEGLYLAHIFPFEQAAPLASVLEEFKTNVLDQVHLLFRSRRQVQRPAVLKSFVLFELLQPSPQADVITHLMGLLPTGAWGPLESQIVQAIARLQPPDDPGREAWTAYEHEQFDRAADLLWELPNSVDVLRALIRCVDESKDTERAKALVERVAAAPDRVRGDVEAKCPKTWPRVRDLARLERSDPQTWVQRMAWRSVLGEDLDAYIERWKEWARAATVEELLQEPQFGSEAAQFLEQLALESPSAFERIFPLWHEVFVASFEPRAQLKPVYAALLETLRLPGTFGAVELKLIRDVLSHLINAGLSASDYLNTLSVISLIFKQVRSPHNLHWAIDVCDVLAIGACPDPTPRLQFLIEVMQAGQEFRNRISEADAALLRMLAEEAGIDVNLPKRHIDPSASPRGGTAQLGIVGIYSLDEAAARRAVQVLQSMYGSIDVRINTDVACTPQLKALVHRAAVFVFAWKTSKHAAFYCVKAASHPGQALEMAAGAGTSSIVDAVVRFMAGKVGYPQSLGSIY